MHVFIVRYYMLVYLCTVAHIRLMPAMISYYIILGYHITSILNLSKDFLIKLCIVYLVISVVVCECME